MAAKMSIKKDNKLESLALGSVSGLITCLLFQPLDLLKTRIQTQSNVKSDKSFINRPLINHISQVIKQDGIFGLWRGTTPTIIRNVPGMGMYFYSYEKIKQKLGTTKIIDKQYDNLVSGGLARTFVGFILNPVTLIKVRIESNLFPDVKTVFQASKNIYKEGGILNFFKGFFVTACRDAPYAAIYTHFYFFNKKVLSQALSINDNKPNLTVNLISGLSAGLLANGFTQPFDYLKTKVQVEPKKYPNFILGISRLYQQSKNTQNFVSQFYKGFLLRSLRKSMSSAISWLCYEQFLFIFK